MRDVQMAAQAMFCLLLFPLSHTHAQPVDPAETVREVLSGRRLNQYLAAYAKLKKDGGEVAGADKVKAADLRRLNVTRRGGNFGLLRTPGPLKWPPAVDDVLSQEERQRLDRAAAELLTAAKRGPVPPAALKSARDNVELVRQRLGEKINDIPTADYLRSARTWTFLTDVCDAVERGEVKDFLAYLEFAGRDRTVAELFDYLLRHNLTFTYALQGDDEAYLTVHLLALRLFDQAGEN